MNKPNFERCTSVATELLYKQNIEYRILDIRNLNYDKTIIFDSIQSYCILTKTPITYFISNENQILRDGCTIYDSVNNIYIVLYNDMVCNFEHLNWTLAHEIGHIYLGHKQDGPLEEIEAHFFAAQLFMPEHSIYMMSKEHGKINKYDLIEIFGVSEEAAEKRIKTMKRKTCFRATKIDREIWNIQKKRVDLYYSCLKDRDDYRFSLDLILDLETEFNQEMLQQAYS